jgi:nitrogen regulatory protein PII
MELKMNPVKRIEIVVDAPTGSRVTALLEKNGLAGWTQIHRASGSGDRGQRQDDELTGVASNTVIVAACPVEDLDKVLGAIQPLLARRGGMCLVSDALWLQH